MLRFIHLADLHLGAEPGYLGDAAAERCKDFETAFERAVDYALAPENDIHFVIIAGDFFDRHNPSPKTLSFAIKQLKILHRSNIPIILVPGNHDSSGYPDSVYNDSGSDIRKLVTFIDSPNVEHIETLFVHGEAVHIYGMAWHVSLSEPPFDKFKALRETDGYHIAVIHGTLENAHFIEGHKRNIPLELENLAESEMDYIALGHIHSHQKHTAGSIPVVYPGTLEGKRFVSGEFGERKLVVVTLEKGKQAKFDYIPWNEKELVKIRLDLDKETVETSDELVDLISERHGDPNSLLRLVITGAAPFIIDVDDLAIRLAGDFFWSEILDKTNVFDSQLVDDWTSEETIRGLFIRKLSKLIEEEDDPLEQQKIELALRTAVHAFNKTVQSGR